MHTIKLSPTQSLAKDISRNIAVTAGAGSGKTEVLTQRLVYMFQNKRSLGIRNVLVLTFTEKAAGEMKDRFRFHLSHQLARENITDKEKAYWRRLKEEFSENHISTIHAFCASVLRRYPIEADIDPSFGMLEGFDMRNLLQESIKTVLLRKARDPKDTDLDAVLDTWRRSYLLEILFDLVERRWELKEWIEQYRTWESDRLMDEIIAYRDAHLAALLKDKHLSALHKKFKSYIPDSPGTTKDSFSRAKEELLRLLDALLQSPPPSPEQALEIIHFITKIRKPGKVTKAWSKYGLSLKEGIDELNALLSRYPLADFSRRKEEEGIRILRSLAMLLTECIEEYQNKKRENQVLDFEDLQIETTNILTNYPKICRELASQFRYIMVDEFQDTNDLQWEIIRQLATDNTGKLMPDKLFIVGDEKQSVYSFRGADVTTFGRARAELMTVGSTTKLNNKTVSGNSCNAREIVFDENFRSSEELIRFNNAFFHRLFSRSEGYETYEASPQALRPGRETSKGSVELLLANENDDKKVSYQEEACLIAQRIRQIYDGDLPQYRDITQLLNQGEPAIAILLRRRTHLKVYEEALRNVGLDFIVPGGQGFFQRQEIKDFSNILDFLVNPRNNIALAGVLRSPLVGISDDTLFTISRAQGNTLWDRIQNFTISKSWDKTEGEVFFRGKEFLSTCLQLRDRLTVSELIRNIADDSAYPVIMDSQMMANVEKLISMARKYERIPWKGLHGFTAFLDEQIVQEEKEEGNSSYIFEGAIQLLTIHHSKGLEFPLVIIPDLSANFFVSTTYYLGKLSHPAANSSATIQLGIKAPDPNNDFSLKNTFYRRCLVEQSRKKALAELKRLLYVAVTRTQKHLILAGQIRFPLNSRQEKTLDDCRSFMEWTKIILQIESLESARLSSPEGIIQIPITSSLEKEIKSPGNSNPPQSISTKTPASSQAYKVSQKLAKLDRNKTIRLSPTALSCFASCPRSYFFRYILGSPTSFVYHENDEEIEKKDRTLLDAILRGLVAHSLLEDEIFDNYEILRSRLLSQIRHTEQFTANLSVDDFCKEVYVNLQNYRDSDTFKDSSAEFYNEVPFEFMIGSIKLYGIIDKLYRSKTDGLLKVLDFKTNAVLNLDQAALAVQKHRYDLQVQCYCLAGEKITGEKIKEARLFFSHIPSEKREIIIPFDSYAQDILLSKLDTLGCNIKAENYPASSSSACETCSYNSYCDV